MLFNSKVREVDGVQTSELNFLGNIGYDSVFGTERDDSTDGSPETEREGHKPDVRSVKADKAAVNVDQWYK